MTTDERSEQKLHVWQIILAGDTIPVTFRVLPDGSLGESWFDPAKEGHAHLYGWTRSQLAELVGAYRWGYNRGSGGRAIPLTDDDQARLVRVFTVAELAHEWANIPAHWSTIKKAEADLTHAVDALEPGDLALLARLAGLGEP